MRHIIGTIFFILLGMLIGVQVVLWMIAIYENTGNKNMAKSEPIGRGSSGYYADKKLEHYLKTVHKTSTNIPESSTSGLDMVGK